MDLIASHIALLLYNSAVSPPSMPEEGLMTKQAMKALAFPWLG